MRVEAVKITDDQSSFKIAYEKNGKYFVRSGEDNFSVGNKVHSNIESLWKWGFRKVENPPNFRDSDEMLQNYNKFQLKSDGSVTYTG